MYTMNTQHIPRIRGYAEAVRLYNNTHPIRGRAEPVVPLRTDRRQPDMCWLSTSSVGTPHIIVGFYWTDQIVFYADGRIVVDLKKMRTRTTRAFTEAILQVAFVERDGYLTFNGTHIVPGASRVTLYRDAQNKLILDDEQRGFPVYVGHAYAPQYRELGKRIALWRRRHRLLRKYLTDDIIARRLLIENTDSRKKWATLLMEQPIDENGWLPPHFAMIPPPSSAMTAPYRLYTTTTLRCNNARVVEVLSFKQLYDSVKDGRIAVKD